MTPQQIADCQCGLLDFTRTMFKARKGSDMLQNYHQQAICDKLEQVVIGKIKRLIITIPPRSGKTELAVINFIAWATGLFPDSEWIHASYSKRLATNNAYNVRELMRHDTYTEIFPTVTLRTDSAAKDEFRTEQGGVVYATGSEGSITGRGAGGMGDKFQGAIIIDDPHKPGEAASDTMRENVVDWFSTTMESRKNSPDTPIIVIMQRLHERDLAGYLLDGGNGEKWEHLNIPAITEEGASFWEKQFPIEDLRRMEKANSYRFAGQYMQLPAPAGGGIFKEAWFNYYQALPEFNQRIIYGDTAQKTKEENDFTVFQCWGKTQQGQMYLIDQVRGKWEAPELIQKARHFWDKHKADNNPGKLRSFKIEDKVSGTGLIQTLKRHGIPVIPIKRNIDKVTRAYDAAPMIESGNVYFPGNAPWVQEFVNELKMFPMAAHDDQVDPMMDAINDNQNARQIKVKGL